MRSLSRIGGQASPHRVYGTLRVLRRDYEGPVPAQPPKCSHCPSDSPTSPCDIATTLVLFSYVLGWTHLGLCFLWLLVGVRPGKVSSDLSYTLSRIHWIGLGVALNIKCLLNIYCVCFTVGD